MTNLSRQLISLGKNFLVHAALLAIGVAVLHYGAPSERIIAPDLLQSLVQSAMESIPIYIGDTVARAERWALFIALESLLFSSAFLVLSNAVSPAGPTQARSRLPAWFAALVLLGISAGGLAWWLFVHKNLAADFAASFLTPLLIASGFTTLIAYYIGTAWGIKPAMRPSVPFADAWLR